MKKYKLINLKTKEEHLCDVVEKDGYKIYVSETPPRGREGNDSY